MTNLKWKRIMSYVLSFILLSALFLHPTELRASEKVVDSRAIGIVFDNSGSMYLEGEMAWCRATYSIEVIASMLNAGDVLQVYPMHPIEVEGVEYTMDSPLVIMGPEQAGKIRNIYTPQAAGTPIETITAAYKGLQKVKADKKWLIVLTDGQTFYENNVELTPTDTQLKLSEVLTNCANKMDVIYLGIGSGLVPPEATGKTKYSFRTDIASVSTEVLQKLTVISNLIFGRDQLIVTGKDVFFDVTLSKLIVFVQGNNINNVQITDESGNALTETASSQTRYSELGSNRGATVDTSLQGVLNVYENLDAGSFELSYTGDMSSIGVYYEPDVDLKLSLFDLEGHEINVNEPVYSGDYELRYELVDAHGETSTSRLLGNTIYTVDYKLNGVEDSVVNDEPGTFPVHLDRGVTLNGKITCDYLNGYSVTKTFPELGWPSNGLKVASRPIGSLKAVVNDALPSVKVSGEMSTTIGSVSFYYNDVLIQGDELAKTNLKVTATPGDITCSVVPNEGGYSVVLDEPADPRGIIGDYEINLTPEYTDIDDQLVTGETTTIPFTIEDLGNLKVVLSNPVSEIKTSELQGAVVGDLILYYEDELLQGDQLDMTQLTISTEPGVVSFSAQKSADGYKLVMDPPDDPVKAIGEFQITVIPKYLNPDQFLITGSKLLIDFKVADNRRGIDMEVLAPQRYFVKSKIAVSEPFTVKVNRDGDPLTKAEMAQTQLTVVSEGLQFIITPNENDSSFTVRINDEEEVNDGDYTVDFLVTGINELGQEITDTDSLKIKIRFYPEWAPAAVFFGSIFIIILLWLFFMTRKVLPKSIRMDATGCQFVVGGNVMKANPPEPKYDRKGKKGSITVTSPRPASNRNAQTGFRLELEAESNRFVPSKKRRVKVTEIKPNGSNIVSVTIRGRQFSMDPKTKTMVPATGGQFKPPIISTGTQTSVVARVKDPTGGFQITVTFNAKFKFL